MRKYFAPFITLLCFFVAPSSSLHAQIGEPGPAAIAAMVTEEFTYKSGDATLKGYVAYVPNVKTKSPIVLVVPEWWGYNEYVKMRARKLAELGYLAMVVDMYGDGKEATTVAEAQSLSGAFYKDPKLAKARLEAAEIKAKTYKQGDPRRVGAIGYCFGGSMVLNGAKQGMDFKGTVSFHGGLSGGVPATPGVVRGRILVCHGGADKFVSEDDVKAFKKDLDAAGVKYIFRVYPNATHAFTNPDATANGKKFNLPIAYNKEADLASWQDMRRFLREVFYSK